MCEHFCIGFIDFMLKGKSLLHYTNLFSLNKHEKNDKIILSYFQLKCLLYINSKKVMVNMGRENTSQELRLKNIGEKNISLRK